MVSGTGIDILATKRFSTLADESDFVLTILTKKEIARSSAFFHHDRYCSVLFTIKEAIFKALRCGLCFGSLWHDIEIDDNLCPRISGSLLELSAKQPNKLHVSVASAKGYALSIALVEMEE
jgi:holo-[acyl-carrier-protein] synthase